MVALNAQYLVLFKSPRMAQLRPNEASIQKFVDAYRHATQNQT